MRLRKAADYGVYVVVRLVICAVQMLRIETCAAGSGWLATLFCDVLKIRRSVIDENLRHAYPNMSAHQRHRLAWRMWRHLFLMVAEVGHARRKIHWHNWRQYVRFVHDTPSLRLLLSDRPMVYVTGHYGNFEVAGYLMGLFGFPTVTVARPLDNEYLDKFLQGFRESSGQQMVPKEGSAKQLALLLEQGATLCLLGDQAAGPKGCWVEFFNRPASTHKAIALFSLGSNAPLVTSYSRRLDRPLTYEIGHAGVIDPLRTEHDLRTVPAVLGWFSQRLEQIIDRAPEQYWWLHRRWKGEPPKRARQRKAA
jgi:KDO2-lipid IV(A) lauroyltransferase